MKKITDEERNNLFSPSGTKNPVIQEILKLKVGENLFVSKEDWNKKTPLGIMLGNYRARMQIKISTRSLKDGSGWVVTRE